MFVAAINTKGRMLLAAVKIPLGKTFTSLFIMALNSCLKYRTWAFSPFLRFLSVFRPFHTKKKNCEK
jgi:hypothetical protein